MWRCEKKANFGFEEHGVGACTLSQVAKCRKHEEGGLFGSGERPGSRSGTAALIVERWRTSCPLSQDSRWTLCTRSMVVPTTVTKANKRKKV